jgi:hypothetical protein
MAERKDRMALLSRYNKLHLQRYEAKSNMNLNVEQWAADALVESYGIFAMIYWITILIFLFPLVGVTLHTTHKKYWKQN